jgi:hypothetical protein
MANLSAARHSVAVVAIMTLAITGVCGPDAHGQHWGTLSGGRGSLTIESEDFDQFVDTFNGVLASSLSSPLKSFGTASGWNFDVGYETVFGVVGSSFSSGLHRYTATNSVRFSTGDGHDFEISVQDLTGSWEILIYRGYLYFGPGLWLARRRVTLDSRATRMGDSPLADQGLAGEYTGSSYELRWGGIAGAWWGPFRISVRVLRGGRVLGGDGLLFSGETEKLGKPESYFPRDYRAFVENGVGGRISAVRTDIRGRIVEFAVAISFPL